MSILKETYGQAQVIKVTASIFFDSVQEFDAAIQEAEDAGASRLVIDVSGAEMICSSAITTLVKHHSSLKGKGHKLYLAGCNQSVKKVLVLLGLDKLVELTDNVADALR